MDTLTNLPQQAEQVKKALEAKKEEESVSTKSKTEVLETVVEEGKIAEAVEGEKKAEKDTPKYAFTDKLGAKRFMTPSPITQHLNVTPIRKKPLVVGVRNGQHF